VYLEKMTMASARAQNMDQLSKFWDLDFQKNVELKAALDEARVFRSRVKLGIAISAALLVLVLGFAFYRRNLSRKKSIGALTDLTRQLEEAAQKGDLDRVRDLVRSLRERPGRGPDL
jgi:hypothetical protein